MFFSHSLSQQTFLMCYWPITTAAATHIVCGVVKLNMAYLTKVTIQWDYTKLNVSILMMGPECNFLLQMVSF